MLTLAARIIDRPTSVLPVKFTPLTSGWFAKAAPATSPIPGIMFTTPGGKPFRKTDVFNSNVSSIVL